MTTLNFSVSVFDMAVEAEAAATNHVAAHHHHPLLPRVLLTPVMVGIHAGPRRNQRSTFHVRAKHYHQLLPIS